MPDGAGSTDEFVQLTDLAPTRTTIDLWPTWTVRFRGIRPGEALMRDHLTVRILEASTGRLLDDDTGTGIEVRHDETARDEQTWMARWTPRAAYCKETVYFVIGSTTQIISRPFKLDCPENVTDVEDKPEDNGNGNGNGNYHAKRDLHPFEFHADVGTRILEGVLFPNGDVYLGATAALPIWLFPARQLSDVNNDPWILTRALELVFSARARTYFDHTFERVNTFTLAPRSDATLGFALRTRFVSDFM